MNKKIKNKPLPCLVSYTRILDEVMWKNLHVFNKRFSPDKRKMCIGILISKDPSFIWILARVRMIEEFIWILTRNRMIEDNF